MLNPEPHAGGPIRGGLAIVRPTVASPLHPAEPDLPPVSVRQFSFTKADPAWPQDGVRSAGLQEFGA
jgi:hypothetical protein